MKSSFTNKTKLTRGVGYSRSLALAALGGLVAISSAVAGNADKTVTPVETSSIWEKPAWLTDLSLRVGESYDTDVYLAGVTVAPGDDIATKNKTSLVTTISPKINTACRGKTNC